jgi:hypothetical protein
MHLNGNHFEQRWPMTNPRLRPQPAERRAFTIAEFCEAFRISRQSAYVLMRQGKLKYFKMLSRRRIAVEDARAFRDAAS